FSAKNAAAARVVEKMLPASGEGFAEEGAGLSAFAAGSLAAWGTGGFRNSGEIRYVTASRPPAGCWGLWPTTERPAISRSERVVNRPMAKPATKVEIGCWVVQVLTVSPLSRRAETISPEATTVRLAGAITCIV